MDTEKIFNHLINDSDFVNCFCSLGFWWKAFWRGKRNMLFGGKNVEIQVLMSDFAEVFTFEAVERKRNEILMRKRNGLLSEPLSFSRRFELIFLEGVIKDNWLGKGIIAAEASEYDDLKNGVDVYADFGGEIGVVGIDITLTKKIEVAKRKLSPRKGLPIGFTNIAFYTDGRVKSGKRRIPRFVIGIDSKLAVLLQRDLKLSKRRIRIDDFGELSAATRENILTQIYLEILLEMDFFYKIVDNEKMALRLEALRRYIWGLLAINIEKRKKLFSNNIRRGRGWSSFRKRQMAILDSCLPYKNGGDNNAFICIIEAMRELSLEK